MIEKAYEALYDALPIASDGLRRKVVTELLSKVLRALSDDGPVVIDGETVALFEDVIERDVRTRYTHQTTSTVEGIVRERKAFMLLQVGKIGHRLVSEEEE